MKFSNEYIKVGIIGIAINSALNIFVYLAKGVAFGDFFPCYLVWICFLLIGLAEKFGGMKLLPEN
ncbi:MAG: hypothetical protein ACI85I_002866 [Arenicella sp.]|jgi:hypothetical protein